jgi:Gas vesicle synthesis protein GvpL/GvpF
MKPVPQGRYVYAIVGGSAPAPRARGIGGRTLVRVRAGRVAAIAEPMDRAPAPEVGRLRAQERLVRRLAARHAAILPARFGSHTTDERELQAILRVRGASLARGLSRVRGAEQMILRLHLSEASGLRRRSGSPVSAAEAGRRSRPKSGTAYLRRLAGADVPALKAVRDALAPLGIVRGERVEVQRESISVYHLIRRGRSRPYAAAVHQAIDKEPNVAALVSGPWPPYAFAPELIE